MSMPMYITNAKSPYTSRRPSLIRAFGRCKKGIAAVEFAIIAPIMLIFLMGMVDYAVAVIHTMELESAARSGAQYAMFDSSSTALIQTTVQSSTNLNVANLNVTVATACECSDGAAVSCSGTCAVGTTRHYMTITATYAYTPIFIPTVMNLSAGNTIRIQ